MDVWGALSSSSLDYFGLNHNNQFFVSAATYYLLSTLFPAKETYLDTPVLANFDSVSHDSDSPATSEVKVEVPDMEKGSEKA